MLEFCISGSVADAEFVKQPGWSALIFISLFISFFMCVIISLSENYNIYDIFDMIILILLQENDK